MCATIPRGANAKIRVKASPPSRPSRELCAITIVVPGITMPRNDFRGLRWRVAPRWSFSLPALNFLLREKKAPPASWGSRQSSRCRTSRHRSQNPARRISFSLCPSARIEPFMSMRVRSKRTASCLKKSSAIGSRWVRITFGGERLRMEGRSPSWDSWNEETRFLSKAPLGSLVRLKGFYRSVR